MTSGDTEVLWTIALEFCKTWHKYLLIFVSHEGPQHGEVPPRGESKTAAPQRAMAIPVLIMVYFRHKGPYQANTN